MQKVVKQLVVDLDQNGMMIEASAREVIVPVPAIRNGWNSQFIPQEGEINNEPSMTIPDEAISISELVARFANGLPISDAKEMFFDGDENGNAPDVTDMRRLDLQERKEILEDAKSKIAEARRAQEERRAAAEKARLDKLVEDRVNQRLEKQKQLDELKKELGQ